MVSQSLLLQTSSSRVSGATVCVQVSWALWDYELVLSDLLAATVKSIYVSLFTTCCIVIGKSSKEEGVQAY